MKRNWKVDNTALVGEYRFWHGQPERLPATWVHSCQDNKNPWFSTTQGLCPSAYTGKSYLCIIQKLDNLRYLEWKYNEANSKRTKD